MAETALVVGNKENYQKLIKALDQQVSGLLTPAQAKKFLSIALLAAGRNPKLCECTGGSIAACVVQAAELGLPIGPTLGMYYLIPRKNKNLRTQDGGEVSECTGMIGYKGWAELMRRSGEIGYADADVVYDCDEFKVTRGSHPSLIHVPDYTHEARSGENKDSDPHIIGAYAVVSIKGVKNPIFTYLPLVEIRKRRARSAAKGDGPWVTDFAAMCRKTAILALLKGGLVPLSADAQRAILLEPEEEDAPAPDEVPVVTQAPSRTGADRVRKALGEGVREEDLGLDKETKESEPAPLREERQV